MTKKEMHEVILTLHIKEQDIKKQRLIAAVCYRFLKAWERDNRSCLQRIHTNNQWYEATYNYDDDMMTILTRYGPPVCVIKFEEACRMVYEKAIS